MMLKLVPQWEAPYPSFLDHLRSRYGRNWCVAHRASRRTAGRIVLTPKRYKQEWNAWAGAHPTFRLAETLPECDEKTFILEAVLARLN